MAAGLRIEGWYDADSNRVDIRQSLRPHGEALAAYAVGDVVLSKVAKVRNGKAELVLYPQTTTPPVVVTVLRADVTANPADDLRTLMTVGEVIPARITATGPDWALALHDVDDDEPIVSAPSLLPGGPPGSAKSRSTPRSTSRGCYLLADAAAGSDARAGDRDAGAHAAPAAATPRPSPAMLDRSRPGPNPRPASTPPAPHRPTESTRGLLLKVDGLTAEIAGLKREVVNLQTQCSRGPTSVSSSDPCWTRPSGGRTRRRTI